jgi:RimJ/RimL family protein N-acetyltransferase
MSPDNAPTRGHSSPRKMVFMKPPDRIAAGPVLLRRIRKADVDTLLATINESLEHLRPWMPWAQAPNSRAGVADFVAAAEDGWNEGTEFNYGIWSKKEEELVGGCGLHARIGIDALEIGYWIAEKHTRRGYATEAARALTQVALDMPTIKRVEIHCDQANVHSSAIAKALGYRLDRIQDDEVQAPAEIGREMVWVVSKEGVETTKGHLTP